MKKAINPILLAPFHVLYECDPDKYTTCKKTGCAYDGQCHMTRLPQYAKLDEQGQPIVAATFSSLTGKIKYVDY